MEVFLEIAGSQIDGARDYQEDAFLTSYIDDEKGVPKGTALIVMADGMGGHAAGNIASNMVVSTFNKHFTGRFGSAEVPGILRQALDNANEGLKASINETPALDGMGCTMVTAAVVRGRLYWISVGDSHLYLIRDRELLKKNEDHSYGGYLDRMKAQGMEVEAEQGLSRNMLMSAITGEEIAEVDCPDKPVQLLPGDRLIIASDGLDTLSPGTLLQTSLWSPTPKECVEALLKAVEDAKRPRQDNTTVVVCDVVRRDGEPLPPPRSREERDRDAKLGDTQPIDMSDLRQRPAPAEPAVAETEQPAAPGGGRKGLLIALVVAVLVAIAAGAGWYFTIGPGGSAPPVAGTPPESASPTLAEPEPQPPEPVAVPEPEPEPAPPPAPTSQPAAEPAPVAETTFRDRLASGGEGPLMVRLPGGTFLMGTFGTPTANERPEHEVEVRPFAMGATEVTVAEYERFARTTGRRLPDVEVPDRETYPVYGVSWDDALAYVQWLSRETGERYRLPSEAQWEYAATAGTNTPYWWGYELGNGRAHCFGCTPSLNPRVAARVGSFEANPFGLHDTVGNIAEWVHDCYHPNYEGAPGDGGVWEGGDCSVRVVRGGSYSSPKPTAQKRDKLPSTQGYPDVGIRVARDL